MGVDGLQNREMGKNKKKKKKRESGTRAISGWYAGMYLNFNLQLIILFFFFILNIFYLVECLAEDSPKFLLGRTSRKKKGEVTIFCAQWCIWKQKEGK